MTVSKGMVCDMCRTCSWIQDFVVDCHLSLPYFGSTHMLHPSRDRLIPLYLWTNPTIQYNVSVPNRHCTVLYIYVPVLVAYWYHA